jgi:hypothetical protein
MARKRKPGRPKGSKNKKAGRKRKVGRPKGSKVTKKTRKKASKKASKKRGRKKGGFTLAGLKKLSLEQVAKLQQKVYSVLKGKQKAPSGKKRGRPRRVTMVSAIPNTLRMGAFEDDGPPTIRMQSKSSPSSVRAKRLANLKRARAVRKANQLLRQSAGI